MHRMTAARARAASLFLWMAAAAAACRAEDTLPVAARIPLPRPVAEGATMVMDSTGLAWVGEAGRLTGFDSAGRAAAAVEVPGDSVPRLLWRAGGRLVIQAGPRRLAAADAAGGRAGDGWASATLRAAARDPRGRWVYTATRRGGVVGLDAATLTPRWGWPETGGDAVGVAVSPLADRVYVSVDENGDQAAAVQVRDAASGRVLMSTDQPDAVRGLVSGPAGALYGVQDGQVVRLRHAHDRVERVWATGPDVRGRDGGIELRVDPTGRTVAVFGRGRGARLALLEAATGRVLGQTKTAPLDAAFDVRGRLYLLEPAEIQVLR